MKRAFHIDSPIGQLHITVDGECVTSITVADCPINDEQTDDEFSMLVKEKVEQYFTGKTKELDFAIKMNGTPFQMRVWDELRRIPYGGVATYGEIARRLGKPAASRAVGMACNRNKLLLAVPCHRVVGAGGKLTGFAVGIERKEFLLSLEMARL